MDMKAPLVSVLMPVYNGMPVILNSIKSLIWQTYENWECIIVDDGSTDGTAVFLDGLSDQRFKIIHLLENKGRGFARQVCLEHASGVYIAYLDADDWCDPEKLNRQVAYLENNKDVVLVSTGILSYGAECQNLRVRGKGNNESSLFVKGTSFVCPAAMIRKTATHNMSYNLQMNVGEDVDFFSRCLVDKKYAVLDSILYYYAEYDSLSVRKMKKYSMDMFKIEKTFKSLLKYLFYCLVAPIIGTKIIVYMRGTSPTESEKKRFFELQAQLQKKSLNI